MEPPDLFAGQNIERARVAAGALASELLRRRRDDGQVLVNTSRRGDGVLSVGKFVSHVIPQVDHALVAEIRDRLTGSCIESVHAVTDGVDDPRLMDAITWPIGDPSVAPGPVQAGGRKFPDRLAGLRVQRSRAVRLGDVHHAVHDQRAYLPSTASGASVVNPNGLQVADVLWRDLSQWRIASMARVQG